MSEEVSLLPHNEEAYEKLVKGLEEKQFVSVNHATGTGKSFIMLKYLLANKDKKILYLAPTYAILDQLVNEHLEELNIPKKSFASLNTLIYSNLLKLDVKELARQYDIIVLDEYHRCGAEQWGLKIDELISTIKSENLATKVIGTTATEIRYLDNERNMNEALFDGNCVSELRLADAILQGILPVPVYVNASYELNDYLLSIESRIKRSHLTEEKKDEILANLYKLISEIEKTMKAEKSVKNYLSSKGKYIVFSSRIDNFFHDREIISQIIDTGIDNEYMVSSDESLKKNRQYLKAFRDAPSDENTVLYSVNLLNEGVHVKDVDAIFMLRATSSPIIYFQQLGRLLSYSKRKDKVVIFDLVNNYKRQPVIYDVYIKVVKRATELIKTDPANKERYERILENFKVIDYSSLVCQKLDDISKKYSEYNLKLLTLEESVDLLEQSTDFKDISVYMAYLNLFRYQKCVTLDIYDRLNKLDIEKPGIFNTSREEFVNLLNGYKNIYQKEANIYKDLYKEIMKYYQYNFHLPRIFGSNEEERILAKKMMEGFDKFTKKMQNKLIEYMDDSFTIVEKITYGIAGLPTDKKILYQEIDKLLELKVIISLSLASTLNTSSSKEDRIYLNKILRSNETIKAKLFSKEEAMLDDDELIKNIFTTRKDILYREKFFIISKNVQEEFSSTQDKEKYVNNLIDEITSFIVTNRRILQFNKGEDITPEDVLFCKKVLFREYLKGYDFNKLLLKPKKSTTNFDYLFEFMDTHHGEVPSEKNSDNTERMYAKRFEKHRLKMTKEELEKFTSYLKKYEKDKYEFLKEYINFLQTKQRRPLSFYDDELIIKERYERIKPYLSQEELANINKITNSLDSKIEYQEIAEHMARRREKMKKNV